MYAIVAFSPKCVWHYDRYLSSLHLILNNLLQLLDRLHVCCGQPDSHFVSMVNAKKGKIISSDGASIDQYTPVAINGEHYQAKVQTGSCEMVSTLRNALHASLIEIHCVQCTTAGVRDVHVI